MEKLARAIIKKNKDIIGKIDILDSDDTIKLLYLVTNLMLNGSLDDINSFFYIQYMIKISQLNFYSFDNTLNILKVIDKNKFKMSHKLLSLKYNSDMFSEKIALYKNIFMKSDGKINCVDINNISHNEFGDFVNGNFSDTIHAFDEKKFINSLKMSSFITNNSTVTEDTWNAINTYEITERLILMVEMFGLELLKYCKIKLITLNTFNNMSFNDKVKYYMKCCKKLSNKLMEIKADIIIYKSMEEIYNKMISLEYNKLKDEIDKDYTLSDDLNGDNCINVLEQKKDEDDYISSIEEFDLDYDSDDSDNIINTIVSDYMKLQ